MVDPLLGAQLGRYRVVALIGAGGMGKVYRGQDPALDRDVAIKLVSSERLGRDGDIAEARLIREGQALAQLTHPNVVRIYDVGRSVHGVFVAMELVDGEPLSAWIDDEGLKWKSVLSVYVQAGRGLAAGHDMGIVHRDFKPSNVMVDKQRRARVLDFGLARLGETPPDTPQHREGSAGAASLLHTDLTADGNVMGTPLYMAPEQHIGRPATPRTDQFSFCLALFESLGGGYPYDRSTLATLASSKRRLVPQPPSPTSVPRAVWRVLLRGLEPDPQRRWASMDALLTALIRSARRRQRAWIGVGLTTVSLLAVGLAAWQTGDGPACTGGDLDALWNPSRVDILQQAFETAAPGIGAQQWGATRERLDHWSERWSGSHQRACEAAQVEDRSAQLLDRRMHCLRGQADELAALLDEYEDASRTTVAKALTAVAALPDPDRCLTQPEQIDDVPPELASRIEAVHGYLRRSRVAYHTGRPERALQHAEHAVELARPLEQPDLLIEALMQRGTQRRVTAGHDRAIDDHTEAYFLASERSDPRKQALAASRLTFANAQQGRADEAIRWAAHTRAALRRAPELQWIEITVLHALGDLERRAGRHEAALEAYGRALSRIEDDPGELGPLDIVRLRQSQGVVLGELGRYDAAIETLRPAVEQARRHGGQLHPTVVSGLSALGIALWYRGSAGEAVEVFAQAERTAAAVHGDDHPRVTQSMINRAGALVDADEAQRALQLYERAQGRLEGRPQTDEASLARLLSGKGRALSRLGRYDDAIETHRRVLGIRRSIRKAHHPEIGVGLVNLAIAEHQAGEHSVARRRLEEALGLFEAAVGPTHPRTLVTKAALAKVLVALGEARRAKQLAAEAAAAATDVEIDPAERADIDLAHARATWAAGDPAAASAMIETLRGDLQALGPAGRHVERELNAWER